MLPPLDSDRRKQLLMLLVLQKERCTNKGSYVYVGAAAVETPPEDNARAACLWTPPSDISSASQKPRDGPTGVLEQNRQSDTDNAALAFQRDLD